MRGSARSHLNYKLIIGYQWPLNRSKAATGTLSILIGLLNIAAQRTIRESKHILKNDFRDLGQFLEFAKFIPLFQSQKTKWEPESFHPFIRKSVYHHRQWRQRRFGCINIMNTTVFKGPWESVPWWRKLLYLPFIQRLSESGRAQELRPGQNCQGAGEGRQGRKRYEKNQ